MTKILILGGTREAVQLASKLVSEGHIVITSLAGRTKEPLPVAGETRIGGFGGIEGLASYLKENQIEKLIDATHPFAKQISSNALLAAECANTPLEVTTRPPWEPQDGDNWIEVDNLQEARDAIPKDARVLLALGRQHIDLFKLRDNVHYLVRMVDQPDIPLPLPNHKLLIGKPNLDWQEEANMLQAEDISHIVCRNSGGKGAYAKIEAARKLKLPVIMVVR